MPSSASSMNQIKVGTSRCDVPARVQRAERIASDVRTTVPIAPLLRGADGASAPSLPLRFMPDARPSFGSAMSFDRLAPYYYWMERTLGGDKLQRCRLEWVEEVA